MKLNQTSLEKKHIPVMLEEVIKICHPKTGGLFLDCTFGGGSYSNSLLKHQDTKIFALDRDKKVTVQKIENTLKGLSKKERVYLLARVEKLVVQIHSLGGSYLSFSVNKGSQVLDLKKIIYRKYGQKAKVALTELFIAGNETPLSNHQKIFDLGFQDNITFFRLQKIFNSQTDKNFLVYFYQMTGGKNWENQTNWLSNQPISRWYGIEVNDFGRVSAIRLSQNNLSGQLPEEIEQLTGLEDLDLSNNSLIGSIPTPLMNLPSLKYLQLYSNQLTGSIPDIMSKGVEDLNLSHNLLTGTVPESIGDLTQLKFLNLLNNQFQGKIPKRVKALSAKKYFDDEILFGFITLERGDPLLNILRLIFG